VSFPHLGLIFEANLPLALLNSDYGAVKMIAILAAATASRVVEVAAIHVQTNARAG
jgi:hypothetical protein